MECNSGSLVCIRMNPKLTAGKLCSLTPLTYTVSREAAHRSFDCAFRGEADIAQVWFTHLNIYATWSGSDHYDLARFPSCLNNLDSKQCLWLLVLEFECSVYSCGSFFTPALYPCGFSVTAFWYFESLHLPVSLVSLLKTLDLQFWRLKKTAQMNWTF